VLPALFVEQCAPLIWQVNGVLAAAHTVTLALGGLVAGFGAR